MFPETVSLLMAGGAIVHNTGLVSSSPGPTTQTIWTTCGCAEPSPTTPVSTCIDLGAATLTGITIQPSSSPARCYQLPTPLSALEPMALPVNQILDTDATDPVFFYVGDNGTAPQYLGSLIGSSSCLLDLSYEASCAGRLAMTLPGGHSLVFDRSGIQIFGSACDAVSTLSIDNFWQQVVDITGIPPLYFPSRQLRRRSQAETNFTVQVQVDKASASILQSPEVDFGQSPCHFQAAIPGDQYDTMSWTCQYPGPLSGEKQCEAAFNAWLSNAPDDPVGSPGNLSDFLNIISPFLSQAGSPIASLLPRELSDTVLQGLQWLGSTAQGVAAEAVELSGMSICQVIHAADEYNLVLYGNTLVGTRTMGAYVTLPTQTIVANLVNTPREQPTREPPRIVQPDVTTFPIQTDSTFWPLIFPPSLSFPRPRTSPLPTATITTNSIRTTVPVPEGPPLIPSPVGPSFVSMVRRWSSMADSHFTGTPKVLCATGSNPAAQTAVPTDFVSFSVLSAPGPRFLMVSPTGPFRPSLPLFS